MLFNRYSRYVSVHQGMAYIVGFLCWVLPVYFYQDHQEILGEWPLGTVIAIATVGGAVIFPLWMESGERLIALVPGLVAGVGAGLAGARFPELMTATGKVNGFAAVLLIGIGITPGIILLWAVRRVRGE